MSQIFSQSIAKIGCIAFSFVVLGGSFISLPHTKRCRQSRKFSSRCLARQHQSQTWALNFAEKLHWRSFLCSQLHSFSDTHLLFLRKLNHPSKSLSSCNLPITLACAFIKRSLSVLLLTSQHGEINGRSLLCCTRWRAEKHHSMVSL